MSDGKVSATIEMEDARQIIQAACELVSVELDCRSVGKHDYLEQDRCSDAREARLNDLVEIVLDAIAKRTDDNGQRDSAVG